MANMVTNVSISFVFTMDTLVTEVSVVTLFYLCYGGYRGYQCFALRVSRDLLF